MGSMLCCFNVDEEHPVSIFSQCICLGCLTTPLIHMYSSLFHRQEEYAIPASTQGTTASSLRVRDSSICDTYHSPPRPLPFDDPRYSHLQHNTLISRLGKGSSHSEESEPHRTSNCEYNMESASLEDKCNRSIYGCPNLQFFKPALKQQASDVMSGLPYFFTSSEDEDVCPTCLDEYTPENPRIIMQCSHHFHLGCIYEWMERSEACPVCGKVMVFSETT